MPLKTPTKGKFTDPPKKHFLKKNTWEKKRKKKPNKTKQNKNKKQKTKKGRRKPWSGVSRGKLTFWGYYPAIETSFSKPKPYFNFIIPFSFVI